MVNILPPAAKLPLTVRQDVRDKWDAKKESLEQDLSKALGVPWTIDIDIKTFYPYTPDGSYIHRAPGSALKDYVDDAIREIGRFEYDYGKDGLNEINTIAHAHVMTMVVDEAEEWPSHGPGVTANGELAILFTADKLDRDLSAAWDKAKMAKALDKAAAAASPDQTLSVIARLGIAQDYTNHKKLKKTEDAFKQTLKVDSITLSPNFEQFYSGLKAAAAAGTKLAFDDWEKKLGSFSRLYFEAVESNLRWKNFDKDAMLQEAFKDEVSKSEVALRLVDELKDDTRSTNSLIEDGVLYILIAPGTWGRNIDGAGRDVIDLL